MKICFVIGEIQYQGPNYTTTHLAYQAYLKGHQVSYLSISDICIHGSEQIWGQTITLNKNSIDSRDSFLQAFKSLENNKSSHDLSKFDVIFFRVNPNTQLLPFKNYQTTVIHIAQLLKQKNIKVINDPDALSLAGSKFYLSRIPQSLRPKFLISRDILQIKKFIKDLNEPVVIKPPNGYGGHHVYFIKNETDVNLEQIIQTITKDGYALVEQYISSKENADKRVLLWNGDLIKSNDQIAAYQRISPKGEFRSNMRIGAKRAKTTLSKHEFNLIENLSPLIKKLKLEFVGIDIIDDKLIEMNIYCPGGIHNINELYQINLGEEIISKVQSSIQNVINISNEQKVQL